MKAHLRRAQIRSLRDQPSLTTFHRFPPVILRKYSTPPDICCLHLPTANSTIDGPHPIFHRSLRPSSVAVQDKERHQFNRRQDFKKVKGKNANKQSSSDANSCSPDGEEDG